VEQVERRIAKSGQETNGSLPSGRKVVAMAAWSCRGRRAVRISARSYRLDDALSARASALHTGALLDVAKLARPEAGRMTVYGDTNRHSSLTSHWLRGRRAALKPVLTDGQYHDLLSMARLRF